MPIYKLLKVTQQNPHPEIVTLKSDHQVRISGKMSKSKEEV